MKRLLRVIEIVLAMIILFSTYSNANVSISNTSLSVNEGETKTVTLTGNNETGTVSVSSSNSAIATATASSDWIENNSVTITITGKSVGTANIIVNGKTAIRNSNDGKDSDYSKTISVNVVKKETSNNSSKPAETTPVTSVQNPNSENRNQPAKTTEEKSNNANLTNIETSPVDFSGFRKNKTSGYSVEVENDADRITINTTKENANTSISLLNTTNGDTGKSWVYLKEGENVINVTATAEDGKTTKTYTINVTRKAKNDTAEKTEKQEEEQEEPQQEEPEKNTIGLAKLEIENLELDPEFNSDVYEYKSTLKENLDKLDIIAIPAKEDANIEITGNENLQEGENIITVIVKGVDEAETVAYQITVNKEPETQVAKVEEPQNNNDKIKKYAILAGAVGVLIIIAIAVVVKNKNNINDYDNEEYEELNSDYENDNFNVYENNFEDSKQNENIENNVENDEENYYEEVPKKKKRSKGKRFK